MTLTATVLVGALFVFPDEVALLVNVDALCRRALSLPY